MIHETELNKGAATPSHDVRSLPKLENLGITWMQSSRYQTISKMPESDFEKHIVETKASKTELTEAGLIKEIKKTFREEKIKQQREAIEEGLLKPSGEFDVIVIDPPWKYDNQDKYNSSDFRGQTEYPEMTQEELLTIDLPYKDDCVLWLWTTNHFMKDALELVEAWGFTQKSILTWD